MVRHSLLAFLAIAAVAEPGLHLRGAAQATPVSRSPFAKRVVTAGLANPFQVVWGPDDYLWVTERTAGRELRGVCSECPEFGFGSRVVTNASLERMPPPGRPHGRLCR